MGILIAVSMVSLILLGIFVKRIILNPALKYHSFLYKVKAAIIFKLGDIRYIGWPGLVTWASREHELSARDMRDADAHCLPGDIGLHRDNGYLSNLGIPGAFKHAWFITTNNECIEAVSEGVLKRDRLEPLISDYVVILRARGVNEFDKAEALRRAHTIVGSEYDANFSFNFEEIEERAFSSNLHGGGFHGAFSCTEVVGFSWYHKKNDLRIFRTVHAGREAIIADDYLTMNFDVVYASPSVTPEWARAMGLGEAARSKLAEYWQSRKS